MPRTGKRGGACHLPLGKNYPGLVMLNHTNTLNDVTTLAHEMGHAMHTECSTAANNALHYGYGMFTAEVASTFMEDYVYQSLMDDLDKTQRLEMLMQRLNDTISTVQRQISCYTYEQELHEAYRQEGFLTADRIGQIFTNHMAAYMGPYVSQDE